MSSTGIRAGRAYVEIGATDKFSRPLDAAKAKLRGFGDTVQQLGAKMAAAGLAMAAPLTLAGASFARFDDQMRAVGAVTRANATELESLTAVAAELGRTTSFTAVQVGALMTELGRAGFSPKEVEAMTAAVLDLSRATNTEAATAAGIVSSSLRQFALDATEGARVADVLTMAANATFSSVEGLGESLKYAGPVAADLGMSLEDTVAILGTLGNVGIQGSEAGTALRRLSVITAATGDDLKKIFDIDNVDATGKLKPLVQILDEIGAATASLPVAERVAKMEEAFGLLGITSASVLSKTGDGVSKLAAELNNAAGTANKAAVAMDAGPGGAIRRLLSAAEGTANALGKALGGAVIATADAFSTALADVTKWIESNKAAVMLAASFAAGLVAVGAGLIGLSVGARVAASMLGGLAIITKGFAALTTAATLAVNFARVSALLLAAAHGIAAGTASGLMVATVALNAANAISPAIVAASSAAFGVLGAVLTALAAPTTLLTTLAGLMSGAWTAAAGAAAAAWSTILAPLLPFIAAAAAIVVVVGAVAGVLTAAAARAGAFSAVWNGVAATLGKFYAIAQETFGGVLVALKSGEYSKAASILWAGVKAAFWTGLDALTQGFVGFWSDFLTHAKSFGSALLSVLADVFYAIPKLLWSALTTGKSLASILGDALTGNVGHYFDAFSAKAAGSRAELSALVGEANAAAAATKALAEQEKELKAQQDAKRPADPMAGATPEQRSQYKANAGALERMKEESLAAEAAAKADEAIRDRIAAIEDETRAINEGEAAAERFKLAQDGANVTQLAALDAANAAKAAATLAADMRERVDALNAETFALQRGEQVAERFKLAQLGATAAQLAALDAATRTAEAARKNAKLLDDGKALREAMRNPIDVFRAELGRIKELEATPGAIDPETARRAREKARDDLAGNVKTQTDRDKILTEERRRLAELVKAGQINPEAAGQMLSQTAALINETLARAQGAGDRLTQLAIGTFSGFAASRMSSGEGNSVQTQIAKSTAATAKETVAVRKAIEAANAGKFTQ